MILKEASTTPCKTFHFGRPMLPMVKTLLVLFLGDDKYTKQCSAMPIEEGATRKSKKSHFVVSKSQSWLAILITFLQIGLFSNVKSDETYGHLQAKEQIAQFLAKKFYQHPVYITELHEEEPESNRFFATI